MAPADHREPRPSESQPIPWSTAGAEELDLDLAVAHTYEELRRLAGRHLSRHVRGDDELSAAALVNEAYLRLAGQRAGWRTREHFLAIASRMMRRALLDQLRRRGSDKRGGRTEPLPIEAASATPVTTVGYRDDIQWAMASLSSRQPRQARVLRLRALAGLTIEEAAQVLDVAPVTVRRDWDEARAWLRRQLGG